MSIAPLNEGVVHLQRGPYRLIAFDKLLAPWIASWVSDDRELFWLAPKTPPPITAAKVVAWTYPGGSPMLLCHEQMPEPLGYVELNPMPGRTDDLWMGHCLVRPEHRGTGLGRQMVDMLIDEAFEHRCARTVSLVVFPENIPAVRCYRQAGFKQVGEQVKYFPTTRRRHCMLEMRITPRDPRP